MGVYLRPKSQSEAVAALRPGIIAIAGGTDFYPPRVGRAITEDLLDITGITEFQGIAELDDCWRLGAAVRWSDIINDDRLPTWFETLRLAARQVGGVQIQNGGTLAGNICNASPAADGVPALLALNASVELVSAAGTRRMALHEFIRGNRKTALSAGELVSAILVPKPRDEARSTFLKLGARAYLVISIAMVAAVLEIRDGRIAAARIAVGACSAKAERLGELEAALVGKVCDAALGQVAKAGHMARLAPIDDVRASAEYRREAALVLVRRALTQLGGGQ